MKEAKAYRVSIIRDGRKINNILLLETQALELVIREIQQPETIEVNIRIENDK